MYRTTVPNWLMLRRQNEAKPKKSNSKVEEDNTIQNPANAGRFWRKMERGGIVDFLPAGFVRDRQTFISLTALRDILQAQKNDSRLRYYVSHTKIRLEWNVKTRLNTLSVGAQRFVFRAGSNMMRANGKVLSLPAQTIVLRHSPESMQLYVPAAPFLKLLKVATTVDVSRHCFEIQFAKASL